MILVIFFIGIHHVPRPLKVFRQNQSVFIHNISFGGFFPPTKFLPVLFNFGTVIMLMDKEDPNASSTTPFQYFLGW